MVFVDVALVQSFSTVADHYKWVSIRLLFVNLIFLFYESNNNNNNYSNNNNNNNNNSNDNDNNSDNNSDNDNDNDNNNDNDNDNNNANANANANDNDNDNDNDNKIWDPYIRQHFHGDKIIEIGKIQEFQVKLSVAVRLKSREQERKFGIW